MSNAKEEKHRTVAKLPPDDWKFFRAWLLMKGTTFTGWLKKEIAKAKREAGMA
jgi:hypothetical protein